MRFEIAVTAWLDDRERKSTPRGFDLHFLDRLLQRFGVIERSDIHARESRQHVAIQRGNAGLIGDGTDAVLLAFFDLEGDQEALPRRIVFRQCGDDLHVGETVLQIIASNKVTIGLDTIRIVDVVAAEEAQEIRLARLDDVLQPVGRISLVADELDRVDAGLAAFLDREDQVDAVVRLLDDFGNHSHVVAAGVTINVGDPLCVGLNHRTRQRSARLRLNLAGKLFVLDLLVAFENHAADDRVFDHRHDDPPARLVDFHVLEQAGLDQALQAIVDAPLVQLSARTGLEIGANGRGLDAAISLDLDRIHGLRGSRRRREPNRQGGGKRRRRHDQGGQQASPYPHSNLHAASALTILLPTRTPTDRQITISALLVANFAMSANLM